MKKQVVYKVGDKVEIIGNIPFQFKDKPRPLLGTITNIDGSYILVRPKYQRYECEFYPGEVRKPKRTKETLFSNPNYPQ